MRTKRRRGRGRRRRRRRKDRIRGGRGEERGGGRREWGRVGGRGMEKREEAMVVYYIASSDNEFNREGREEARKRRRGV